MIVALASVSKDYPDEDCVTENTASKALDRPLHLNQPAVRLDLLVFTVILRAVSTSELRRERSRQQLT